MFVVKQPWTDEGRCTAVDSDAFGFIGVGGAVAWKSGSSLRLQDSLVKVQMDGKKKQLRNKRQQKREKSVRLSPHKARVKFLCVATARGASCVLGSRLTRGSTKPQDSVPNLGF